MLHTKLIISENAMSHILSGAKAVSSHMRKYYRNKSNKSDVGNNRVTEIEAQWLQVTTMKLILCQTMLAKIQQKHSFDYK